MKKILCLLLFLFLPFTALAAEPPSLDNAALQSMIKQNRGTVIMLNFFATWCPPCRKEIPELIALRKKFTDKKLLLIGLSVDENAAPVEPFVEKYGINYPVFMAQRSVTDAYNVSSVPHNVFIAPTGELVISEPGMADSSVLDKVVSDLSR